MKALTKYSFWRSLLWKQNTYHQHGVFFHTLRVTWELIKHGHFKMVPAGILHDIGKPGSAIQEDPQDIALNQYSFTDHEEASYLIIKDWFFISFYTKELVRHHYLIRRMAKAKKKKLPEQKRLNDTWNSFSPEFKKDLGIFLHCDDLGKGNLNFRNKNH